MASICVRSMRQLDPVALLRPNCIVVDRKLDRTMFQNALHVGLQQSVEVNS